MPRHNKYVGYDITEGFFCLLGLEQKISFAPPPQPFRILRAVDLLSRALSLSLCLVILLCLKISLLQTVSLPEALSAIFTGTNTA